MTVSRRLRFEILRRDNHACRYCGATAPEVKLTVDHVVPVALGGSDDPANLVSACASCNGGKTSLAPDAPLVADVGEDQLRWARAMRDAAEVQLAKRDALEEYLMLFGDAWNEITSGHGYEVVKGGWKVVDSDQVLEWGLRQDGQVRWVFETEDEAYDEYERRLGIEVYPRPTDWESSVETWFVAGVELKVLCDYIEKATRNPSINWDNRWRWFCGHVWNYVRERQGIAAALLAKEGK